MTIANVTTRQGNGSVDCGGAQIRAHCRHLATVLTVRGEIDAFNVDRVSEHIRRSIVGNHPVVLDMSDVSQFATAGISLLYSLDEDCHAAGVEWTLVASPAVFEYLGDGPCFRSRARCTRRSATWPTPSSGAVSWCCPSSRSRPRASLTPQSGHRDHRQHPGRRYQH